MYTGEIAEHLVRPEHDLVEMHSAFATISVWIYCALLIGEIILIIAMKRALPNVIVGLGKILTNRWLSGVMALVALITISVTGLLGGVMVYGTSADPFAEIVLKLLGL